VRVRVHCVGVADAFDAVRHGVSFLRFLILLIGNRREVPTHGESSTQGHDALLVWADAMEDLPRLLNGVTDFHLPGTR